MPDVLTVSEADGAGVLDEKGPPSVGEEKSIQRAIRVFSFIDVAGSVEKRHPCKNVTTTA